MKSQTPINVQILAAYDAPSAMSDTEEVQLPIPARTTVSSDVAPSEGSRGGGRGGGGGGGGGSSLFLGFGTGLSSRKFGDGGTRRLRTAGSRRQNLASNGSNGRMETEGSVTGGRGGGKGSNGGSKACTACGIQFTWRQRRHHCRACRKVSFQIKFVAHLNNCEGLGAFRFFFKLSKRLLSSTTIV